MFRYLAVGGGLLLFIIWVGPIVTAAVKRLRAKQDALYQDIEDAADAAENETD